jgi:type II secretory ATPase GspE/PulE/Tfp pilus assembly ATPase PilB-like protein
MARAFFMVVVDKTATTVTIALGNPHDIVGVDTVHTRTNLDILTVQADRDDILRAIEHVYGQQIDVDQSIQDIVTVQEEKRENPVAETVLQLEADETPVIQLVNLILHQAMGAGASDIHIEPRGKTVSVRIRIDGMMKEIQPPPKNLFHAVVSRIKIIGHMDIAERRIPQDGRARISIRGHRIDLRISTLPTVFGESVGIRLLDKDNLTTDVENLGLNDIHRDFFMDAIARPFSMVYVTGPTGSGKTTTLYSALQHLNTPERKIVTVEDPVEYEVTGINQVHVHGISACLSPVPSGPFYGRTRM